MTLRVSFLRPWRLLPVILFAVAASGRGQDVTTYMYDNVESGVNAKETMLTPANVNVATFGPLFNNPVDGQTYAQPLYLSNVSIAGKGSHNVVYVATCHDTIYAFDADAGGDPLWTTSFLDPGKGITSVPQPDVRSGDIQPEIGVVGTPVIDPATGTLYVVGKTKETGRGDHHNHYVQKLHALDVATGAEKFGGPQVIGDVTYEGDQYDYNITQFPNTPGVKGTGDGNVNGMVYLNALRANQRPSLVFWHGVVYIPWSSHGDNGPYHGWLIGFDAKTLAPLLNAVWCDTPDGGGGGIWQSGCGPAITDDGSLFISTANGAFNGDTKGRNFSQSFMKFLTGSGLSVATLAAGPGQTFDYFSPYNEQDLSNGDVDVGTAGMVVFDAPGTAVPHRVIGSGKEGIFYVLDRDNMGQFDPVVDRVVQKFEHMDGRETMATPVFFNNTLYYNRDGEQLRARVFKSGLFADAYMHTADSLGGRGGGPVVSANGTKDGIVWVINNGGPAHLEAFSADALTKAPSRDPVPALYNGRMADDGVKFTHPLVINGKVYAMAATHRGNTISSAHLCVFGLLQPSASTAKPQSPVHVKGISTTPFSTVLSWVNHDPNVTGFVIERSAPQPESFAQVGTADGSATTYTDNTVTGATDYKYRVTAVNKNGASDPGAPLEVKSHAYVSEKGLVAAWAFDEGNGSVLHDFTGHGHDGDIKGEASWSRGILDSSSLEFHGTGNAQSRVEVKDSSELHFTATQSFSISAWARPSSLPGHWAGVVTKAREAATGWYGLYLNPDNRWTFRGPDDQKNIAGNLALANSWQHLVAVQDGAAGTRTLYFDGVAVATGPVAQDAGAPGDLWIGQGNTAGDAFAGMLDEVQIYKRALGADDVKRLYGAFLPVVSITEPADNASVSGTSDIRLTATASTSVPGSAITEVHFYDGTNELGRGDGNPSGWTWHNAPPGDHVLTARAKDSNGNISESLPVHVKVTADVQPH